MALVGGMVFITLSCVGYAVEISYPAILVRFGDYEQNAQFVLESLALSSWLYHFCSWRLGRRRPGSDLATEPECSLRERRWPGRRPRLYHRKPRVRWSPGARARAGSSGDAADATAEG